MNLRPGHDVPASTCLNCGKALDAASAVDEKSGDVIHASEGDVTICIRCGHLMVFGEGLVLRNPTDEEIVQIAGDKRMVAAQRAIAGVNKFRK